MADMADMAELVDITALEAWERLRGNGRAVLLDVRSEPEWDFVGVPLVDGYLQISWRHWPDRRRTSGWVAAGLPWMQC